MKNVSIPKNLSQDQMKVMLKESIEKLRKSNTMRTLMSDKHLKGQYNKLNNDVAENITKSLILFCLCGYMNRDTFEELRPIFENHPEMEGFHKWIESFCEK